MSDMRVGTVASLHRFPVKSMLGEELETATLQPTGLLGDRAYALLDDETQKVISVKRPRRWGRIFELAASTRDDGSVAVTFPDASVAGVDEPDLNDRLSAFFGRRVSIADTPPANATFDEAWERDLKNGADPYFGLPSRIEEGDELIDAGAFMGPSQNFFNFGAVHLVTTGTTRQLSHHAPESRFDPVRFRPNVVIETDDDGFLETAWQGCTLAIGSVRLAVSFTVPRCVMTTLAQGDCPADRNVLRTITEFNSVDVMASGAAYPCVGVYADVTTAGDVRRGDPVLLVT